MEQDIIKQEAFYLATITPEIAERWLEYNNIHNRPLQNKCVYNLAKEMKEGRWVVNGDTIRFSKNRTLLDGQHRLWACIEANVPFQSYVICGLDMDVFDTLDSGKRRTGADVLSIYGEQNTACLAAALALVDRYMTSRMYPGVRYANSELLDLAKKYPKVRDSTSKACGNLKGLLPNSIMAACHYLFSLKDPKLADEVMEKVRKGTYLADDDPIRVFRERLLNNSISKAKLSREYIMALFIKAWNAARAGRPVRALRYQKDEAFPVVQ